MVFTLGTLFEAGLLLINAVAILNEEKFLKKGELCQISCWSDPTEHNDIISPLNTQWVGDVTQEMKGLETREV